MRVGGLGLTLPRALLGGGLASLLCAQGIPSLPRLGPDSA